ncbi:transposase domain-containing protein [Citreimonas salinaria]|uniref:Mu DNA-binding domain-containing protein n=1 Tax=Citreimonas salinaria TaxID=321339 RepID=A0A1H3KSU9_9RHOB|nr:transposase domain-containing protein [Citreimonas salinaria]SDY54838.1 Mu DNA-binding domain-containing protein [Citreimonas salinaria]
MSEPDVPQKTWWSAAEIAAADLPDMPATTRGVNEHARRNGWANQPGKVRRRAGRGGGLEYHHSLFPTRAAIALISAKDRPSERLDRAEAWAQFDAAKDSAKRKAEGRLAALDEIDALECAGLTRSEAVRTASAKHGKSEKTLWNWIGLVNGIAHADRLAYLVPGAGGSAQPKTEVPERFLELVKSAWLTQSAPDLSAAYSWATDIARSEAVQTAPLWKIRRVINATVPDHIRIFHREGVHGLRRYFPHQTRSKMSMHAMEAVQGDYHKFDVFVLWPGEQKPVRVQMIAFSDIYSGKFLAWRLSITANSHTVQLCFGDLVKRYGIPFHALLDNGREFAAKAMTGGTPTRFRFKIRDDDVPGLLTMLGVHVHWAQPAWGQAKPIERAFKDFCARVAKHPAFVGAYTGNRPDAKPENYGDRAIPLSEFKAVLEREIAAHNARRDRRSDVAFKRSFDDVFNESYKTSPVRKATEEQQLLWLLRAEGVRGDSKNGELKLYGHRYWAPWMYQVAGQKVVARFDPDALLDGLRIYDLEGRYLGDADVLAPGDFLSVDDARDHARKLSAFAKATKAEAAAHKALTDTEIAARLRAAGQTVQADDLPEAEVVRLVPNHRQAPKSAVRRPTTDEVEAEARLEAQVTRLSEHRPAQPEDDPQTRFDRALELEAIEADGHPLTEQQRLWLTEYSQSAEYRAWTRMRASAAKDE